MKKMALLYCGLLVSVVFVVMGLAGPYLSYEAQGQIFAASSSAFELESQKVMTIAVHEKEWMSYIPSIVWYSLSVLGVVGAWFFGGGVAMSRRGIPLKTMFSKKYWSTYYGGEVFYREPKKKRVSAFSKNR